MLEDGTWRDAPWMSWDADSYFWRCWMCSTSGVRVTNDHLTTPRHTNRVSPDNNGNYLGWYHADVGRQQMLRVQVHANYLNRRQQQLALPAPPGEPPAQPPPEAPPQHQQQQQAPPVPAPAGPPQRAAQQQQQPDPAPAQQMAPPGLPAPPVPPTYVQNMLDQITAIEGHIEEMAAKMERMEAQGIARSEANEEMNMIMSRVDQRQLLISDRIAETNVLLNRVADTIAASNTILSGMVAAGSASAAIRSLASGASSHQSSASPPRNQHQ